MGSGRSQEHAGRLARPGGTHVNPPPDAGLSPGSGSCSDPELERVYLEHAAAVYRSAYRAALGDHEAAEDATQEAFMETVRDWLDFQRLPADEQRKRLCGRARWRVIDSWRATSAEHPVETLPDQPASHSEDGVLASIAADTFWKKSPQPYPSALLAPLTCGGTWNGP